MVFLCRQQCCAIISHVLHLFKKYIFFWTKPMFKSYFVNIFLIEGGTIPTKYKSLKRNIETPDFQLSLAQS